MKRKLLLIAAVAAAAVPMLASAQFAKPEDAIKYRQSALTVMGTHFSRLGAMVTGKTPWDTATAQYNIAVVNAVHNLAFAGFVPGSDKGTTKADPKIWSDQAGFTKARDNLYAAVGKLNDAGKSGNEAAIKTAFGDTGKTCKGCHDDYRMK
jgi:cytochrome c556